MTEDGEGPTGSSRLMDGDSSGQQYHCHRTGRTNDARKKAFEVVTGVRKRTLSVLLHGSVVGSQMNEG
jgi:hypothetical protein